MIRTSLVLLGTLALVVAGCHNNSTNPPVTAPTHFLVTALAGNRATVAGLTAANVDTNLRDTWGLSISSLGGFWVANRASGTSTIYDSTGHKITVSYRVNGPDNALGSPTGIVQNTTQFFPVGVLASTWIYSQLNGTLAAIPMGGIDSAQIVSSQYAASSSYTGLALVTNFNGTPYLYAPNVKNGSLDQFDQNFSRRNQTTGNYPNYTPFNAVLIDTQMFVTYARMSTVGGQPFVGIGPGNGGYVDIYNLNGTFEKNLITGDSLDSPWGMAIAPPNFGPFSGDLLIGNFGDGTIHAYDRSTGALIGTLTDANNNPIVISGLWALVVYNGTLYYTAGPNGGTDGVFGKITLQ